MYKKKLFSTWIYDRCTAPIRNILTPPPQKWDLETAWQGGGSNSKNSWGVNFASQVHDFTIPLKNVWECALLLRGCVSCQTTLPAQTTRSFAYGCQKKKHMPCFLLRTHRMRVASTQRSKAEHNWQIPQQDHKQLQNKTKKQGFGGDCHVG